MNLNANSILQYVGAVATAVGLKLLGALALWIVGRWLIKLASKLVTRGLSRQNLDSTLINYIGSSLGVLLNIVLIVAILGFFGVQTATFAALLAGVGIAVGAAWSGLLSNFAAGLFLVMLRPFKVGDFVSAGGVIGTVQAIGLFGTTVNTPDNVLTIVGNSKIFSDTIQNFSANAYRRVDLLAQTSHATDHRTAIQLLRDGLSRTPNVLAKPEPDVQIVQFTLAGPVLAVRPYCHNDHYWQVYFDTNRLIRESFQQAGYSTPEQHYSVRGQFTPSLAQRGIDAAA
jgi:small conductance mechanosensitive channel